MSDASSVPAKAPFFRRLSTVVAMTISLLFMPVAMILILTGQIYRKRDGGWQPISNRARYIYGSVLVVWLIAATVRAMLQPGGLKGEWERSADPALTKITHAASAVNSPAGAPPSPSATTDGGLPTCDNSEVIQTAREAIAESPMGLTTGLKVVDAGKGQENLYDPESGVRRCATRVMLNTGASIMTYQVVTGPSGKLIIQAQVGDRAVAQLQTDEIEAAQRAHKASVKESQEASTPAVADAATNDAKPSNAAPIENSYSANYHQCMSAGDAAQGVTTAMVECIGDELTLQDGKLNAAYKATMSHLDPGRQTNLRNTQRTWIKYRDAKCDEENQTGGTMDQVGRPSCHLELTVRRTQELVKMRDQ
jgi:uncharacterized protein YecT (DUF1311 family)